MKAKKELGQHWLKDDAVLDQIVDYAELTPADTVLEIGPGTGYLTQKLATSNANVTCLEFDKELIIVLERKFEGNKKVEILYGDIRQFDYGVLPPGYKVVANIPYYLTSNLIRSLSETSNPPSLVVLLVQKEVAERLCAQPGNMSMLSVTAQYYFECNLGITVSANLFQPPPKVDSQVVFLTRRASPPIDIKEAELFRLVKAGFSTKRKTLINNLATKLKLEKKYVETILEKSGLGIKIRAQELSFENWQALYENIKHQI